MAVRQYIGARYVPTYYQNSLDPTSSEWEANVDYYPLTIVSLPNMHSYQSKKFVPSTVGSPASNPEYWYDQGYASAYYQALQDQIDDMKNAAVPGSLQQQIDDNASDIRTLTGDIGDMKDGSISGSLQYQINDINDKLALSTGRKIIFVGDSYGNNPNNIYQYPDVCAAVMGLNTSKYINACVSGAGFTKTGNLSFLHQLEDITADRDTYTDIVVLGGTNDAADASSVYTPLNTFMTYAKTNFPNAKIWVGCLTWQPTYNNSDNVLQDIVDQYENAAQFGARIIKDAWLTIHRYDYLSNDRVHPNNDGSRIIGRALASKLNGGDFEASANVALFGTLTSSIGTWSNNQLKECPSDKNIMIVFSHEFEFTSATNITSSASVTLGDVSGGCVYGGTKTPWLVTDAIINDTTAAKIRLTIGQGHILVRALASTISSVSKITIIGALSMPAVCG